LGRKKSNGEMVVKRSPRGSSGRNIKVKGKELQKKGGREGMHAGRDLGKIDLTRWHKSICPKALHSTTKGRMLL